MARVEICLSGRPEWISEVHLYCFLVSDTHSFLVKLDGLKRMNSESKLHEEKQSYASDWSRVMFGIFSVEMYLEEFFF